VSIILLSCFFENKIGFNIVLELYYVLDLYNVLGSYNVLDLYDV